MTLLSDYKELLGAVHTNFRGKSINYPVIIFESDDWGSIRMPSKTIYDRLLKLGIPVSNSTYCKFDGLEKSSDIEILLNTLKLIENKFGKKVIFTLNFVSANPDFEKIRSSNFKEYYFEPFTLTYDNYDTNSKTLELINEGISNGYFSPQFHGRDHVNVPLWLILLETNIFFKKAFDFNVFGLSRDVFPQFKKSIQATYDSINDEYIHKSLKEGLLLFNKIFSSKASSFISNNYIWNDNVIKILNDFEIKVIQGMKYQLLPIGPIDKSRKMIRRVFGEKNEFGMLYNVRNCDFEPTEQGFSIDKVLRNIDLAFNFKKPAVISTHRINYTSRLDEYNRNKCNKLLYDLLTAIVVKWPNVKFISSNQLNELEY